MANPLLLLSTKAHKGRRPRLRRARVEVPEYLAGTDVVFLMLQRMRGPLVAVVVVLTISVAGLSMIPGIDADGNPYTLKPFEAFYVMSYTATTIGFGEIPYAFNTAQRMWMTASIYGSVTVWAYSIGALFAILQDTAFQDARHRQSFRRRVARMPEPFLIVCGYGQTGRAVCRALDDLGRAFVVVDERQERLEALATDQLMRDAPALEGDVRDPAMLGLAGLGHPRCEGVVAVTDDDDANLAVVMSGHLLRPELPVIARAGNRTHAGHMTDFGPAAVINPDDHYGAFLVLALERPVVSRLVDWLMAPGGTELSAPREGLSGGRWIVLADGRFGQEVCHDLETSGLDVALADPDDEPPDLQGLSGFVAGSDLDATNLAYAARARLESPDAFIAIRQHRTTNSALLEAFSPDSVYVPTDLVAREVLARVVTPLSWSFVEHALTQDDEWGLASSTCSSRAAVNAHPGRPGCDSPPRTRPRRSGGCAITSSRSVTSCATPTTAPPTSRSRPSRSCAARSSPSSPGRTLRCARATRSSWPAAGAGSPCCPRHSSRTPRSGTSPPVGRCPRRGCGGSSPAEGRSRDPRRRSSAAGRDGSGRHPAGPGR
ncbi:NAD-binding protein [Mobilicoccus caccae]|uniref:RCK N-terminal domain-containing protein n=1 Tax=Mobilicoccus caccae TaxID=1859295 RepID=A0ABQ6IVB9_9MICO|nr:NAD-binding protein [Mobilicoccus caccae]GMA41391.1 hypothetical protein GCM10025883_34360 [Mobilicoccus caccae]